GWGPALPDPAGARGTPHNRGAGLSGVSRALPRRRAYTTADRAGVPEGVLRFKRDRRPLLLGRSFSTLWAVSWLPPRSSPPTTLTSYAAGSSCTPPPPRPSGRSSKMSRNAVGRGGRTRPGLLAGS